MGALGWGAQEEEGQLPHPLAPLPRLLHGVPGKSLHLPGWLPAQQGHAAPAPAKQASRFSTVPTWENSMCCG